MTVPAPDPSDDNNYAQTPADYRVTRLVVVGNSVVVHTNIGEVTCYPATANLFLPRRGGSVISHDPDPDSPPEDPGAPAIDDYPYKNDPINTADPWAFYKRECVSFCCWRVRKRTPFTNFTNFYGGVRWGNAITWDNAARQVGIRVDSTPAVGSIAVRNTGTYGHVAYVREVNTDGSFDTEEYNSLNDHIYHSYDPSGAGRFDSFIHFEDGP